MPGDNADYSEWVGVREKLEDTMDPEQARGAAAMFDTPVDAGRAGAPLPPLWHWFYFRSCTPQESLGIDGHAMRGDFLPPISLPRRMIAGGRVTFHRPLLLGTPAVREHEVADVRETAGRSGSLVFVTVRSRIAQRGALCIEEALDIVYRGRSAAAPLPATTAWPPAPLEDASSTCDRIRASSSDSRR
jgi:3-methylfumaryl-CoA hydratase